MWDFETHLNAAAYVEWLPQHVRDFEIIKRESAHLLLRKYVDGDFYRLHIVLENLNGRARVHAVLTASPD